MPKDFWIDELDLKIIKNLVSGLKKKEEITTFSLTKKLFPKEKNIYVLKRRDSKIRTRLWKLSGYGIVNVKKENNKDVYYIMMEKIMLNVIPKIKKSISFNVENKWTVFEL